MSEVAVPDLDPSFVHGSIAKGLLDIHHVLRLSNSNPLAKHDIISLPDAFCHLSVL